MNTIYLVQGDTGPQLQFSITETTNGSAVNLSGATVTLHFRAKGTTTVLFSRAANITESNASLGIAILQFNTGDLDLEPGQYEGEVEVILPGGLRQTIYEVLNFELRQDFA